MIKTPTMKFYDKGFVSKYDDYIHVEIFSAGTSILSLDIYDDRVCKDTLRCQDANSFNNQYLHKSYKADFLKQLFSKNEKKIVHKDPENHILIKVLKD